MKLTHQLKEEKERVVEKKASQTERKWMQNGRKKKFGVSYTTISAYS
jgi:hypothetical protein